MLTCSGRGDDIHQIAYIVSWDLQTGGVVSVIERNPNGDPDQEPWIAYSKSGRMVGVLYGAAPVISIYDVVSGGHMYNVDCGTDWKYSRNPQQPWTHGESLRFATIMPPPITIWEARFIPGTTPTQVETHATPENDYHLLQIVPESHRVACFSRKPVYEVCVWDTVDSKFLLRHTDCNNLPIPTATFSSDCRFFACTTTGSEVYLWKEDSTGYTLHRRLASGTESPRPLLSPDGESIITFGGSMVRLWHTNNPLTTPSSTNPQHTSDFFLVFLPNRPLAVVARKDDEVVVVLNLESGALELMIEAGIPVYGLGAVENSVAIIGGGKVVTWDLPGRKTLPDTVMRLEDSAQTISFCDAPLSTGVINASVSSDLRQLAVVTKSYLGEDLLAYDLSTGRYLVHRTSVEQVYLRGGNILCVAGEEVWAWTLDFDATPYIAGFEREPRETPWISSRGYEVTYDGWVLGSDEKRLLMLPPPWQSDLARRAWNGQFLALLHGSLPEPIILDLEP